MMNIISSIVNSGYVVESAVDKSTSVSKGSFRNALQEETVRIKKVSKTSNVKPHDRNESKDEENYKLAAKKITRDDSTRTMAMMKNTAITSQIRLSAAVDKEKIINPVKVKNAYHI